MIIALFTLVPLLVGMVVEYAVFRFTMRETGRGRRLSASAPAGPPPGGGGRHRRHCRGAGSSGRVSRSLR